MQQHQKLYKIEISAKTILFTLAVILILQLFWIVRELFFSFIIAFIIMCALNPAISFFQKIKIPRALSALIIFVALFTGLGYLFAWIIPPVVTETSVLLGHLPDYLQNLTNGATAASLQDWFTQYVPDITGNAFGFVKTAFSNVVFFMTTVFFSFYFLLEENAIKKIFIRFFDKKDEVAINEIIDKTEQRMRDWLWGELILMVTIGVATYIGLSLIGVRYVLPLAVFAGLLEVVPILGPTISAIPAFLVTASQNMFSGLIVIALYFIIQQLENQILVPVVMKRAVGLSPIITLAALIIGGKLAGVLGILLAIPITLCVETIVTEVIKMRNPGVASDS